MTGLNAIVHDALWLEKCVVAGNPVLHFVGQVDGLGNIVVSCVEHDTGGRRQLVSLIRSVEGEQEICVDSEILLAGVAKRPSPRIGDSYEMMAREALTPVLGHSVDGRARNFTLYRVDKSLEADFQRVLLKQAQEARKTEFMFGVLRQAAGQTRQEEILRNDSSPAFDAFLALLGTRVQLLGYTGFKGGLDTTHGRMGSESVAAEHGEFKVMYHVGPLLPKGEGKEQEIGRKRHIGNDVVVVVFQEADCEDPYPPGCLTSHFIHIAVVVRPATRDPLCNQYDVRVQAKKGVKPFEPALPVGGRIRGGPALTQWLFYKCMNGELAAMQSDTFSPLLRLERQRLVKDLYARFGPGLLSSTSSSLDKVDGTPVASLGNSNNNNGSGSATSSGNSIGKKSGFFRAFQKSSGEVPEAEGSNGIAPGSRTKGSPVRKSTKPKDEPK